jgi:hypothetical protein
MGLSYGQTANVVVYKAPFTISLASENDYVNIDTSVPASPCSIELPNINNSGFLGRAKKFIVSDITGNASSSPITISGSLGDSINGAASITINQDYGSIRFFPIAKNRWVADVSGTGGGPPPPPVIPSLQQVLNFNHDLIGGVNFQGTGAATGNAGTFVNAFGQNAATNNLGTHVNALGFDAATANTGNNVNAAGVNSAKNNTGNNVNAAGYYSAINNTGVSVNALGVRAAGQYWRPC